MYLFILFTDHAKILLYVSSSWGGTPNLHQTIREKRRWCLPGKYSYVDPLGSLITVKYTAGPDGYEENRTTQLNFIENGILPVTTLAPVTVKPVTEKLKPKHTKTEDSIAKIIPQLTPFIKTTVSNSLGGQRWRKWREFAVLNKELM